MSTEPDDIESENPEEAEPSAFEGVGNDIVSQLALTAITSPDPVSLAVAVVGPLLPRGLEVVTRRAKAFKKKRQDATLRVAAAVAGDGAQEMVRRIEGDPSISSFVDAAVEAGGNSAYPSRIRALGAALATGVLADDTDTLDVEQIVIESLSRLERPHIRLLVFMAQWSEEDQEVDEGWPTVKPLWGRTSLANELESLQPVLTRLLADLLAAGVLRLEIQPHEPRRQTRQSRMTSTQAWAVSDFGMECLRRLYQAGLSSDPIINQE